MNINGELIHKAFDFFTEKGYKHISVPYLVDKDVSKYTSPPGKKDFINANKSFVASAEQSFLQMLKDGTLPDGKYIGSTPCYRDEEIIDETHFNIFFKVELFLIGEDSYNPAVDAYEFFKSLGIDCYIEDIDENQKDICSRGYELGSYGSNEYRLKRYFYGTALAEPRTSFVMERNNI